MNYTELAFTIFSEEDYHRDQFIYQLAGIGFDTFEEISTGFFKTYIPSSEFDQRNFAKNLENLKGDFDFCYEVKIIPEKNWNEVWESNFEPLCISDQCYVRATFHAPHPEYPYEIIVDPKMAFGTGHHQTTAMMIKFMLEEDFSGKKVLDMGSGTGILAILASKLGATEILAVDHDEICYTSMLENFILNKEVHIEAVCGSTEHIPDREFNIILANINRNILLEQLERYSEVLTGGGVIFLSGFYKDTDMEIIISIAQTLGLEYHHHKTLDNWVAVKFIK